MGYIVGFNAELGRSENSSKPKDITDEKKNKIY
jgi:hypothetical protein